MYLAGDFSTFSRTHRVARCICVETRFKNSSVFWASKFQSFYVNHVYMETSPLPLQMLCTAHVDLVISET